MGDKRRSEAAPEVVLCAGKDCHKRPEYARFLAELEAVCSVTQARCLGVCKGPVAVLNPDTRKPRAFVRLRKPKQRRDFLRYALGTHDMSNRLQARQLHGSKLKRMLKRVRR